MNNILKPHTPINAEDVFVADSPTSLGSMLGYSLAEGGDGILVSRPVYGRFELDYGVESGVEMVYADTATEETFSPLSVEKYELALKAAKERGQKIRAVLLVNPHNPVGEFACRLVHRIELISYRQAVATQLRHSRLLPGSATSISSTSSVMKSTLPVCLILVTPTLSRLLRSSRWTSRD